MLALSGAAGFYGTPVTKIVLCHAVITYILFTFPLQHFQYLFHYNQDVFVKRQFKRLFLSKLVFLDLPDLIFTSLLLYNFRIFERRFGSRKFISHMICTTVLASLLELTVFSILNHYNVKLGDMPTGLFSLVFPFYVPFYCSVPRVALTRIVGIPVTGKTLNYILGLQMASSEVETLLVVSCAVVAGLLWRVSPVCFHQVLSIPPSVGKIFDQVIGRYLDAASAPKNSELPMGATLELQHRERLDRLEQQMVAAAIAGSRRNGAAGGIFGNMNRQQAGDAGNAPENPDTATAVSEEQVQRFVEMGFSDARARQALRSSNNNPRLATNLLLQDM